MTELQQEIIDEYLLESEDILQKVTESLILLESSTHDENTVQNIYQSMNTFKNSSMLFGFSSAGEVAHVMVTSLQPAFKNRLERDLSKDFIAVQFHCVDMLEKFLICIRENDFKCSEMDEQKIELIGRVTEVAAREFGQKLEISEPQLFESISVEKEFAYNEVEALNSENRLEQEGAVAKLAASALGEVQPLSTPDDEKVKVAITEALSEALGEDGSATRQKSMRSTEKLDEETGSSVRDYAIRQAKMLFVEVLKDEVDRELKRYVQEKARELLKAAIRDEVELSLVKGKDKHSSKKVG